MKLPTDREICSLVFSLWHHSLNLEVSNIAACMASEQRVQNTKEYTAYIHTRLKALVRTRELRRTRHLPGRPYYMPA